MKIAVIGTGYVGLVTGACFSDFGNSVICVDIDKKKIESLNNGDIPIFEPGIKKLIDENKLKKTLSFSNDIKKTIEESDIIFITVGTPMDEDGCANLEYIYNVAEDIGNYINKYKIVITKSTIPVGTTMKVKEIISNKIKKRKESLAFDIINNPEFLKEGKAINDFMFPDRIVVGIESEKVTETIKHLFHPFSLNHEKMIFMDIYSSELTKYAANAMLATKISFINEMSIIADKFGADINKIRLGIGSDNRIGYSFIYPSIGYGGSCFPKDINSILNFSKNAGYSPKILNAVNEVNNNQKKYFFKQILNRFFNEENKLQNMKFSIWGLSFKPGTDDLRESASIYIINELSRLGATISVYDPKAMENAKQNYFNKIDNVIYSNSKYDALNDSDAMVLLTEWPEFRSPDFNVIKEKLKNPIIFDGRNQYSIKELNKLGFEYYCIGRNKISKDL